MPVRRTLTLSNDESGIPASVMSSACFATVAAPGEAEVGDIVHFLPRFGATGTELGWPEGIVAHPTQLVGTAA
ncbi:hypothetical protein ERC79_20265 [Rhodococcus sp. ABRD24]|uniref:hypothetical protein n=1 Tax=Rhodococcus sp. ABRD24 TaxID=2507582 RepID=UPI001038D62C|nr:hypothetical protein [Rhodococcus sp. ABRD24]QBJ98013.1 hypothetical protein ERC79_20265 [Rhodococcus sp. ABRD24]